MSTRPLMLLLLVAGLTIGSLADDEAERSPLQLNGSVVLVADFHIHAFPGDGVLPAWELRKEAARRGIDVIAVTNHNQSIAASLPVGGNRQALPLVIPGQEITAPDFHLAAVAVRRVVDWRLPFRRVLDEVHWQGGVAIAAHPMKDSWRVGADGALSVLDGTEAVHARAEDHSRGRYQLGEFYRNARQHNPSVAAIGSSDFHTVAPLGQCFTYVAVDEVSERGVLEAIRRGRTAASDGHGTLIGDPEIVKLVRARLVTTAPSGSSKRLSQLAVMMVLIALLGLVCFR